MSNISSQPEDVAGLSSHASQLSSTTPRIFPTRSVRHPSTKHPSAARSGSGSLRKSEVPAEPSTSSSPVDVLASPFLASQSLNEGLPELTTHAEKGGDVDTGQQDGTVASRGDTGSVASLQYLTTRFEHAVGEDGGHLVLTGRDGELQRCEDEVCIYREVAMPYTADLSPFGATHRSSQAIHAPGAIQSFGCLIAFDQYDRDRLVVQQVSENSRLIIGVSPSTLFRLPSLTAIFDEDEVDVLLDALETLDARDADPHDTDRGPITFTLSGQGQLGTANSRDGEGQLAWQVHCALHRPNRAKQPNRAVLELELVDDTSNPPSTVSSEPIAEDERGGMAQQTGEHGTNPTTEELLESTVSVIRPLRALARVRTKSAKRNGRAHVEEVALLSEINEQLDRAQDLQTFLKVCLASPLLTLAQLTLTLARRRSPPSSKTSANSTDA